jgi:PAS domain S-box-containing protein
LLAEAMPQIVWTAEPDGQVDYFNQQWFDDTGLTFQQSQGRGWLSAVHPDDVQSCIDGWTAAVKDGGPFQVQFRLKRAKNGAYRWHQGRASCTRPGRPDDQMACHLH